MLQRLDTDKYFDSKWYKIFVCAYVFLMITSKTAPSYYILLYMPFRGVLNHIYNLLFGVSIITMPVFTYAVCRYRKNNRLWPFLAFVFIVVAKTLLYVWQEQTWRVVFDPSYIAYPNQKAVGLYFRELANWMRVFSVVSMVYLSVNSKKDLNRLLCVVAVAFIIPLVAATVKRPDMIGVRRVTVGGVTFGGSFWNLAVRMFCSVFWLWFCQFKDSPRAQKMVMGAAVGLVIFGGTVGISRTFIMGFALSFAVYIAASLFCRQKLSKAVIAAAVLFIVVLPLMDFVVESYKNRIVEMSTGVTAVNNTRLIIWQAYLSHIKSYWLLGAEPGGWVRYAVELSRLWAPHSAPLNWIVGYGILGLGCYAALLLSMLKETFSLRAGNSYAIPYLLAWMTAYASVALINETGHTTIETYIGFGLALAVIKLYKRPLESGGKG